MKNVNIAGVALKSGGNGIIKTANMDIKFPISTRDQVRELRKLHPQWTKVEMARAVKPPVTPQRVNQIENNIKPKFTSKSYRARNRHRYHVRIGRKFKCTYCKVAFAS